VYRIRQIPGDHRRLKVQAVMKSPTYSKIAKEVERIGGFVPKTCWICPCEVVVVG